jgi:hypothetical protein
MHLRKIEHLRVKKSTIPGAGMGLFVDDPRKKKGEVVFSNDEYTHPGDPRKGMIGGDYGQVHKNYLSQTQLDKKYGKKKTLPYAIKITGKSGEAYYLNPTKTNDGAAIRANDKGMTKKGWDKQKADKGNQAQISQDARVTTKIPNKNVTTLKTPKQQKSETVLVPFIQLKTGKPGGRPRVLRNGEEIFTHYSGSQTQDNGGYWKTGEKRKKRQEVINSKSKKTKYGRNTKVPDRYTGR